MRMYKYIFSVLGLFFFTHPLACELSDEYKELEHLMLSEVLEPYNDCTNSISKAKYWYKYVQCQKAGDGKNIIGGCADIVMNDDLQYMDLELDSNFCQRLKVSKKELIEYFECTVKEENIKKCK
ncbi:MAG: hypothetical protein ACN4GM_11135 [Gammaproteobacteria bacterium]